MVANVVKGLIAQWLLTWVLLSPRVDAFELLPASCLDFINQNSINVTCQFVSLPLNHLQPDQRTVTLPLLIAHSPRPALSTQKRAILIPGAGGPGASLGFGYSYRSGEFLAPYEELLDAGYDLVMLDQRGAGLATPRLTCVESIEVFERLITQQHSLAQEIDAYQQAASQCQRRLQPHGVNHFDTQQTAHDFLTVMAALDYDWWGTIATSYATVIAQTMLVLEPQAFDRVVLDSPVPLDYQKPLTTESAYQSIVKSIERCVQTDYCQQAYPGLVQAFERIVARAERSPFKLTLTLFNSEGRRSTQSLMIDNNTLLSIFANAIYSNEGIAALPAIVSALDQGRVSALQFFVEDFWYQSIDDTYADALNLTIHCKERQPLESRFINANPGYLAGLSQDSQTLLKAQTTLCANWGTDTALKAPAPVKASHLIKVPTLLLSGSLDPVISAEDIHHTSKYFSAVIATQVEGAGHAVWYQSECVRRATADFFEDKPANRLSDCALKLPRFK